MFWDCFSKKKKKKKASKAVQYSDIVDFVEGNIGTVKPLLTALGHYDRRKRLLDMAQMVGCKHMLLCQKEREGNDHFVVIDATDHNYGKPETQFSWQHTQVAASNDAANRIDALPFQHIGVMAFISVPIKNSNNATIGILLGVATQRIENIDSKTHLLHLMAPVFCTEIECEKLRTELRMQEQRIASLNQNIEVMSTDIQREKEKSAESKELKTFFLTNLSHEIRTPMNVVLGFLDLLETSTDEEERKNFIAIVKQNSQLMLTVIDNLVEMSKLQTSYMQRAPIPQQLNALLDELKRKYESRLKQLGKRNVKLVSSYSLSSPNDTIWNSDEIIQRVFCTLLDNACKYTSEGEITMGYVANEKDTTFYVRDTGCGIKPSEEKTIFGMFNDIEQRKNKQDDDSFTTLGLAMASKYVSLTGGKIWVDLKYVGGALFYFNIPNDKL